MHVLEFALKHVPMFLRTSATNTDNVSNLACYEPNWSNPLSFFEHLITADAHMI
jgi:hypothetical protein